MGQQPEFSEDKRFSLLSRSLIEAVIGSIKNGLRGLNGQVDENVARQPAAQSAPIPDYNGPLDLVEYPARGQKKGVAAQPAAQTTTIPVYSGPLDLVEASSLRPRKGGTGTSLFNGKAEKKPKPVEAATLEGERMIRDYREAFGTPKSGI